jgi:hypothetical protein
VRVLVPRVIAGVLALLSLLPVWVSLVWGSFILLLAAHGPDPGPPEGDQCCVYAETWRGVVFGVAWGLALVAISAALLYATITLTGFAIKGERPKLRRLRRLIAALATVVAAFAAYTAVLSVIY